MVPKSDNPRSAQPKSLPARAATRSRRVVRTIAQGTLFAAGLAVAQFGLPENDPRFPIFSRTLVDKLHEPITRYHE
jgi:hypothetical protein